MKKKYDEIVLLAKTKLSSAEVLISIASINSNISHYEFVLVNNDLKEYDDMREEIKNLKTVQKLKSKTVHQKKTMFSYCLKCIKNTERKNPRVGKTK